MFLSARFLAAVSGVNSFDYSTQVQAFEGDAFDIYVQLVDKERHKTEHGFSPGGQRYMPAASSTMNIEFLNINDNKRFVRTASQPFPLDPSVWKVSVLSTDPLSGTVNLRLVLVEGGVQRVVYLPAGVLINSIGETC